MVTMRISALDILIILNRHEDVYSSCLLTMVMMRISALDILIILNRHEDVYSSCLLMMMMMRLSALLESQTLWGSEVAQHRDLKKLFPRCEFVLWLSPQQLKHQDRGKHDEVLESQQSSSGVSSLSYPILVGAVSRYRDSGCLSVDSICGVCEQLEAMGSVETIAEFSVQRNTVFFTNYVLNAMPTPTSTEFVSKNLFHCVGPFKWCAGMTRCMNVMDAKEVCRSSPGRKLEIPPDNCVYNNCIYSSYNDGKGGKEEKRWAKKKVVAPQNPGVDLIPVHTAEPIGLANNKVQFAPTRKHFYKYGRVMVRHELASSTGVIPRPLKKLIPFIYIQPVLRSDKASDALRRRTVITFVSEMQLRPSCVDATLVGHTIRCYSRQVEPRSNILEGGGTHIFPLWKRLTFKRLILTKSGFRNLNVFFKDLSIDTHHGYRLPKYTILQSFNYVGRTVSEINGCDIRTDGRTDGQTDRQTDMTNL
uniref:SFRICE_007456 n=1 Tax=Spodoptera frugiperda TaxID=7108 RepID=A0A2H1WP00_SPOFR